MAVHCSHCRTMARHRAQRSELTCWTNLSALALRNLRHGSGRGFSRDEFYLEPGTFIGFTQMERLPFKPRQHQ
jgi:hypothetical protein